MIHESKIRPEKFTAPAKKAAIEGISEANAALLPDQGKWTQGARRGLILDPGIECRSRVRNPESVLAIGFHRVVRFISSMMAVVLAQSKTDGRERLYSSENSRSANRSKRRSRLPADFNSNSSR